MKKTAPFTWGWEAEEAVFDGVFYQPAEKEECARHRELMLGAVASRRVTELRLNDYQKWVELDWKRPHHSLEAFERFEKGLIDEVIELGEEVTPARQEVAFINWDRKEKLEEASQESISELGDVLWYGTAMLSNAHINLEACFKEYLHNKWEPVAWDESFKVGDVQERIKNHTPYPHGRKHVSELFLEDVDEDRAIGRDLHYSAYTLSALMSRVFNSDKITISPREYLQGMDVQNIGGLFVAYAAYHADRTLDSSLEEVIAKNVEKISRRAEQNHIDKADGKRSLKES